MEAFFSKKWSALDFTKFIMPSVLSIITISMYMMVDAIFVSRFVGAQAIAAVNIIMPLFSLCFGIGIMVAAGASAIVGIELGEKRKNLANRHFSLAFYFLMAVMAGVFLLVQSVGMERISLMLGASDALLPYCTAYLKVFIFGIAAIVLQVLFEYFMRLDGRPVWAFYSTISSGLTNVALDYWLIVHLDMGIRGAGIASAAGIGVAVSIGIFYFLFKSGTLKLAGPVMDIKFLKDSMINGSSEMVGEFSTGVKILVFNFVMIRYAGENGVAAMAILMQLYFLLSSIHIGLSMGISPVLSFNFGNKNFIKIRELVRRICIAALGASVFAFVLAMCWGGDIIRLFVKEQAVVALSENGMRFFGFVFLVNGVNLLASGFFTSVNNGKISAFISFLNSFVFTLGFVAVLPLLFNLKGVWMSVPLAELTTMALSVFFVMKYRHVYILPDISPVRLRRISGQTLG